MRSSGPLSVADPVADSELARTARLSEPREQHPLNLMHELRALPMPQRVEVAALFIAIVVVLWFVALLAVFKPSWV